MGKISHFQPIQRLNAFRQGQIEKTVVLDINEELIGALLEP
jgi:hypothetical protein